MIDDSIVTPEYPVIAWWSGGITSAVACKMALADFKHVRIVFIDTRNEDADTYRFKKDCEVWYGQAIETITNERYEDIEDVWYQNLTLNIAVGAKCTSELKIIPRQNFCKKNKYSYHVFGFTAESSEIIRAKNMKRSNSYLNPIFPLINDLLDKKACIEIIKAEGIWAYELEVPKAYKLGFNNNNCLKRGCVKGGIGYWQKMQRDFPDKFERMAYIEHELTDLKGEPVTMLKDQAKDGGLVFLKPHPAYPGNKDISMMKGREPEPMMECNGFCSK